MLKYILMILILPSIVCASTNEEYSGLFAKKLEAYDVYGCRQVLEQWEDEKPEMKFIIDGLQASLVLVEGNLCESYEIMKDSLEVLEGSVLPSDKTAFIRDLYLQVWKFNSHEDSQSLSISNMVSLTGLYLCDGEKVDQPTGLKLKYWFGIAQLVAACVVAPFNPPAAGALALSGLNTTVQAASEALDNKREWERNLDDRQRITPENPYGERSSYKRRKKDTPILIA